MENSEEGDSSEGILCSSDDEIYDGLSKAIELHIGQAERLINKKSEASATSKPFAQNQQFNSSNSYLADREFHSYATSKPEVPCATCLRPPASPSRQPFLYRSHSPEPLPSAYVHGGMYSYAEWEKERPTGVIRRPPSSCYLSTPRTNIMRQRFRTEDAQFDRASNNPSFAADADSHQSHTRKMSYEPMNRYAATRSKRRCLDRLTSRKSSSPRRKTSKKSKKRAESKVTPRPINFRISKAPSKLSRSNLDGFYDSDESYRSPEKWPHDRYESGSEVNNIDDKLQKKSEKGKENSPDNRDRSNKKIKRTSRSKSRSQTRERDSQKETMEEEHAEILTTILPAFEDQEDVNVVYEDIEVVEEGEGEKSSSPRNSVDDDDEEEDEELLGLRLTALTSALTQNNRQNVQNVKKARTAKKRKSSTKNTGQLVKNSSEAAVAKSSQKRRKRSDAAELFMKKLIDLTKESDVVQKKRKRVPKDKRLTLVEEIIRNHPEKNTKTEALRYIRSLPDSASKTEMFLQLMKMDENQIARLPTNDKAGDETCEPSVMDNYDEIEMDLEGEDEDPPEPPGTSDELIPPPVPSSGNISLSRSVDLEQNEKTVSQSEPHLKMTKVTESHPDKPVAVSELKLKGSKGDAVDLMAERKHSQCNDQDQSSATPTPQSVWNMLEKPTSNPSQPAADFSSMHETIFGNADTVKTEADKSLPKKKNRIPSDDDKSLLLLRESLLKQMIDKHDTGSPKAQKKADSPDATITSTELALPISTSVPSATLSSQSTLQTVVNPATAVPIPRSPASLLLSQRLANPVLPVQTAGINLSQQPMSASVSMPGKSKRKKRVRKRPNKRAKLKGLDNGVGNVAARSSQNMTMALRSNSNAFSGQGAFPFGKKMFLEKKSPSNLPGSQKILAVATSSAGAVPGGKKMLLEKNSPSKLPGSQKTLAVETSYVGAVPGGKKMLLEKKSPSNLPGSQKTLTVTVSSASLSTASKTIYKTATTLIKTNAVKSVYALSASKHAKMHLPKHQPVVINFDNSSDEEQEEDRIDSNQNAAGPSLLDSIIKQARMKVSKKLGEGKKKELAAEETWPFTNTNEVDRSSPMSQESASASIVVKLSEKKRDVPSKISDVENKAAGRSKPLRNSVAKPPETVKQLKTKFLKLKVLIKNDEASIESASQKKRTKQTELQGMEDELVELMHRVAAIKGKAARTENVIERFDSQEAKLKERLEKRMKLKNRLLDRIKTRMVRSRLDKKSDLKPLASRVESKKPVEHKPVRERTTKLLMEKQRLLVMEKELAEKISQMKKDREVKPKESENKRKGKELAISNGARRRVSLSKEVQSHLKKYNQTKIQTNPSLHDLSLSKLKIPGSPARHMSPAKTSKSKDMDNPTDGMVEDAKEEEAASSIDVDNKKEKVNSESKSEFLQGQNPSRNAKQMSELQKAMTSYLRSITSKDRSMIKSLHFPPVVKNSGRIWERPLSGCLKNLKIDAEDIVGYQTTYQGKQQRQSANECKQVLPYPSPLKQFRSHRLSPFLRTKEGLSIKSCTFSHKIDPDRIFCRYDLTGTCSDTHCKAQHRSDYELSSAQLFLDLLSYCPSLLGDEVNSKTSQADLLKIAENASMRMCGLGINKNVSMSEDQMCILITSKVNSTLGTKAPFTTIFKPRPVRPFQSSLGNQDLDTDCKGEFPKSESIKLKFEHPDQSVEVGERYFDNKSRKSLRGYEKALQKSPHDVQLWIQLAYRRLQQGKDEKNLKNLELALHTMCLALEDNPYKGELWGHYLTLLKQRKGGDSDHDLQEMVSQALELVPLSLPVWKELCSWKYNVKKCKDLFNMMITNLVKNAESFSESSDQDRPTVACASSWLLEAVLRRTQIGIQARGVDESADELEKTLLDFSQQCKSASISRLPDGGLRRCLTQTHLCRLWVAYVNLKFCGSLPSCFLSDSNDCSRTPVNVGVTVKPDREVCLCLKSKKKMTVETYSGMRRSLYDAVKACSHPDLLPSAATASCACLYFQIIELEIFVKDWDRALNVCKLLRDSLQKALSPDAVTLLEEDELKKYATEILIEWADVLVRTGEIMMATHIFDNAVTERPYSAQLCYEAALLQLNSESKDVIAALLYLEACVTAFLEIDQDGLKVEELVDFFRYLLRFSPTSQQTPSFKPGVNWDSVRSEKTYMWLCYCLLLTLSPEKPQSVIEAFEMALIDTDDESERETIWIRYIRYRLTTTPVSSEKSGQIQLRSVTALVRRCLKTAPSRYSSRESLIADGCYSDYSFHNEVADMYLSCLQTRQQLSTAYTALTELMPLNISLLLRACKYFLDMDDYASVISVLWKVTSSPSCQNEMIWKISVFANYARGKKAKYLALLLVHGKQQLYEEELSRCEYYLQMDPESMLQSLKQS